jgi:diaminopimelate dehydrogenase
VVGLGRVGTACLRALESARDLALGAIVRRPQSLSAPLPAGTSLSVKRCEAGALRDVDAALVCVPRERILDVALQILSRGIAVVEPGQFHGLAFQEHRDAIHREAMRHRCCAVVGAGWDPGMLSLVRGWFALLVPKGQTSAHSRPATSLRHTAAARNVPGVREALCTEIRETGGSRTRYVYVELEPGADAERASAALRADPLFLDEKTVVLPVESVAALEEEGHGIVLERWGEAGGVGHQRLLLEARFDAAALTAEVMLAAARAMPGLAPGAHTLQDIAASQLFGARSAATKEARP